MILIDRIYLSKDIYRTILDPVLSTLFLAHHHFADQPLINSLSVIDL